MTLALALLAPVWAGDPTCAERAAAAPTGDGVRCWYDQARATGDYAAPTAAVRALVDAHPDAPWPALTLANLLTDQGEEEAGIALYEGAIAAFDAGPDRRGQVLARLNLVTYVWDELVGERLLDEAAERAAGDEELSARARAQRGRFAWRTGRRLGDAAADLRSLLDELGDGGDYQTRLVALNTLAGIAMSQGRADEAESWLSRLEAHAAADPYVLATASALRMGLEVELRPYRPEVVGPLAEAARARGERAHNPFAVVEGTCGRAWAGPWPGSEALWSECLQRVDAAGDPEERAGWRTWMVSRLGDDPAVRELLAEAGRIARDEALPIAPTVVRAQQVDFLLAAGEDDAAWAATEALLDEMTALSTTSDPSTRAWVLLHEAHFLHAPAERWARDPGDADRALAVTETLRGARQDAGSVAARAQPPTPDQQRLRRALDDAMETLWDTDGPARAAALVTLERLRTERHAADLAAYGPGWGGRPVPTVAALQASLRPDEAVWMVQLPVERGLPATVAPAWSWVVTADGLTRVPLPPRGELEPSVAALTAAWRAGATPGAAEAALGERLLGGVVRALPAGVHHLVVVPDGPLHALPVGGLLVDGARLDARVSVAVTPSIRHWLAARSQAGRAPGGVVVLAGPSIPDLPVLPGSDREAAAVAAALGPGVEVRAGIEATEPALVRALTDPAVGLVHVAAHAEVDPLFPERTRIRLAPAGGADGEFTIGELAGLRIPGTVVVLSACDTASGYELEGEGPLGLGRAFLDAGARAVVATSWPLRDDDAAAFAAELVARLAAGDDVGTAVSAARRARAAAGARPESWAGVVVLGDPTARPVAPRAAAVSGWGRAVLTTGALGALGLAALGVAALSGGRRRR